MSKNIATRSLSDKEAYIKKIKELKGILRIPRLYNEYKSKIEYYVKLEEKKSYELNKVQNISSLI